MPSHTDRSFDVLAAAHAAARRYRQSVGDRPQRPELDYATLRAGASVATPEQGTAADETIAALIALAEPGLNAMTGPRFFGWVIGGSHPVGVAADWLASAWGQNAGNHLASPSAAVAEEVAARWLLDILAVPASASVGFATGATMANFICLAAARSLVLERANWDVDARGLFGAPEIDVLIGDDAHVTVFVGLRLLGLGQERVRRVATDSQGRIVADAFRAALDETKGPVIAIAQAGQLNTGAIDPVGAMADALVGRNAWLHVDGAFGLWARAAPETAGLAAGVEKADSWATDGHKWLQTPYDTGYAIVRHAQAHRRAMATAASYLPSAGVDERDPAHYVPELSRRARGFATWAIIQHLGRIGIAAMVARHCKIARNMAQRLAAEDGVALVNEVTLNQAILRFGADRSDEEGDALTRRTIELALQDGTCFVGGALWRGRWVMRLSVIGWSTTKDDADRSVDALLDAYRKARSES
ncbi:MAG: pyridoxal-dependent decarboxylase [Rhodospirillaceae bacterium]|nr:pyridoxal-dependent decarboxylase [Rhodospirillaceae bacterium]